MKVDLQLGNGGTRKYAYDNRGYLTTQVDSGSSGAVSTIVDTYDPAGRKSKQVRDGVMTTYTMDSDDRLTLSNRTGQLSTFAYDDDRNLTLLHNHGQNAVTMSHNSFGQVVTSIAGSVVTTNTWDNAGRKTVANVGGTLTTFGWDQESRMVSRTRLTTTDLFVYDEANHLRYRHDPNSEEGNALSFNYLDDNTFTIYSDLFGTRSEQLTPLEGVNVGNDDLDFLLDPLGSVIGKTSSSGVEDLTGFFPYGEPYFGARPVSDLWAFVGSLGYRRFDDTLYDVWNRWLETDAGHWKSADALWPSELAYMYVAGMPITHTDFTGLGCEPFRCQDWPVSLGGPCGFARHFPELIGGDGGGIICCNGVKYACVWTIRSKDYPKGILDCMMEHEKTHLADVDCDPKQEFERPNFRIGADPSAEECFAYSVEMSCLIRNRQGDCGSKPAHLKKTCQSLYHARICQICAIMRRHACHNLRSNCKYCN